MPGKDDQVGPESFEPYLARDRLARLRGFMDFHTPELAVHEGAGESGTPGKIRIRHHDARDPETHRELVQLAAPYGETRTDRVGLGGRLRRDHSPCPFSRKLTVEAPRLRGT